MRFVELCFHERDAIAADTAVKGLDEAGVCAIRRPVDDQRAPVASRAAACRIVLHSDVFAALPASHPVFADDDRATIIVPLGSRWPLRRSRGWLYAPPEGRFATASFWKAVAQATLRPASTRSERLAMQQALFRAIRATEGGAPVGRRRPSLRLMELRPMAAVRSARDWEPAVTPMAVVASLALAAGASVLVVDVAARPEAWGAITQAPAPEDSSTNAFAGTAP